MLLYQDEMKEKEKVAMKMKKMDKQIKNLLSNKIDRFALLFEKKNPSFFLEYRALREIRAPAEVTETSNPESNPANKLVIEEQGHMA